MHVTQTAWYSWYDDPAALLPALAAATPVQPPFPVALDFVYHYHPGLNLYFAISHRNPLPRLVTILQSPPPTLTLSQAAAAIARTLTPHPDFPTYTRERDYLRDLRDSLLHSQSAFPPRSPLHTAYGIIIDGIRAKIHSLRNKVREERQHDLAAR